jgi:hypothetical protein
MSDDGESLARFTVAADAGGGSGKTTSDSGVEETGCARPAVTDPSNQDVDEYNVYRYLKSNIFP